MLFISAYIFAINPKGVHGVKDKVTLQFLTRTQANPQVCACLRQVLLMCLQMECAEAHHCLLIALGGIRGTPRTAVTDGVAYIIVAHMTSAFVFFRVLLLMLIIVHGDSFFQCP